MHCLGGNATDPIWRVMATSDRISFWTPLKPQHRNYNPNPLASQLWCIDFLTPRTPLIIPHRLPAFLESLMPLKNWCSIHARWSKSSLKNFTRLCGIFFKFKTKFYSISFFYYANKTPNCLVGPQLFNTMVWTQLLNIMIRTHPLSSTWPKVNFPTLDSMAENSILYAPMVETNLSPAWPTVNSKLSCFSKYPHSQPIASEHDVIHTLAHFQFGVYYENCDCDPLRAIVKLYPMICTWTKGRIVQSPTKRNDKV